MQLGRLFRIVEYDTEAVPDSGRNCADSVLHVHPVKSSLLTDRSVTIGKNDQLALGQTY